MSDQPIRSQSSLYFERYASAQRQSVALGMTVYLLGGVCVVLLGALLAAVFRPRAIYYIPAAPSAGIAYPQHVPIASVISFAEGWLMDWVNYTPETVSGVYERSVKLMMPALLAKVRVGMEEDLGRVDRAQASSVFFMRSAPQVKENGQVFEVSFEGVRAIYAGKEELTREEIVFTVIVRRAAVTALNPYGLAVEDVQKKRIRHEAV